MVQWLFLLPRHVFNKLKAQLQISKLRVYTDENQHMSAKCSAETEVKVLEFSETAAQGSPEDRNLLPYTAMVSQSGCLTQCSDGRCATAE